MREFFFYQCLILEFVISQDTKVYEPIPNFLKIKLCKRSTNYKLLVEKAKLRVSRNYLRQSQNCHKLLRKICFLK
jgi:hypothetical protein